MARRLVLSLLAALTAASCASGDSDASSATTTSAPAVATTESPVTEPTRTSDPPATTPPQTEPPAIESPATTPLSTESPDDGPKFPLQPEGVSWPTEGWLAGPPSDGFDSAAIDAAVDLAFGAPDAEARLRSILAVHGGKIVYERYHPLDSADTVLNSFSVAKSFTSAIIGLLVDDGVLDPSAPAPVPEWEGDDRAEITLEHLLQMRSGLNWEEVYGEGGTLGSMLASPDWAGWAIAQPLEAEPGDRFEYSTGTTAVLAEIVADQVGGPDALEDFMRAELLAPMGITSTNFVEDPTGQFAGGLGFDSTTRDFARFGYLFLRGGVWDGEQILSPEWIEYSWTPSPANPEYSAQWWLNGPDGNLIARGLFGQYILVVPDRDLVIVATATQGGDSSTPLFTLYDQFADIES